MSWFKRTSSVREDGRVAVNGRSSPAQGGGGRDRAGTDPDTCLEVFMNHWQQAVNVINACNKKSSCSNDDVETVVHNFEQMMTLLVGEEGIDGMPGPILYFLLEKEILETFCNWCSGQTDHQDKLSMEQLRMYELLISQSRQLLLIHRQVIRPLLRLLMACNEPRLPGSGSEELEFRLVLVLHQICTCISQETVILESFFSTEADHGPAKFLIFSLLIPYIHKEGPIGQRARDALLLLMTLSAIHPHIGHYIAENSDFCPVLATGLSGLYSSLPRKITPPSDDWYALTENDCQRIVDLQMFLNSLEFCNAVVQVAHPLVRDQLIKFIYTGFLLPVLGPALHQDISGLPIPLLDTAMFMNSRDEVMTATAYLDLFLRRISEPHLIRAFLRFVLTERHDEMLILESLITRINSNSKLSLVSLSLFHTLVDMNCEEIMFQLVFKYLIPCTHVMVSQRRAVRDLDLYGKSAEKFLSLRPVCCMTYPAPTPAPSGLGHTPSTGTPSPAPTGRAQLPSRTDAGRSASVSSPAEVTKIPPTQETRRRSFFRSKKEKKKLEALPEDEQRQGSDTIFNTSIELTSSIAEEAVVESSYTEYLQQARTALEQCAQACSNWSAPYDGEQPPPDSFLDHPAPFPIPSAANSKGDNSSGSAPSSGNDGVDSKDSTDSEGGRKRSNSTVKLLSHGNVSDSGSVHLPDCQSLEQQANSACGDLSQRPTSGASLAKNEKDFSSSSVISESSTCNNNKMPPSYLSTLSSSSARHPANLDLAKLHTCLDDLDSFLACLNEMDLTIEEPSASLEESLISLDSLLNGLSVKCDTAHGSGFKKSADTTHSSPLQKDGGVVLGNEKSVPSSTDASATSTYSTSTSSSSSSNAKKIPLPPRTLGLTPASDVSLGGLRSLPTALRYSSGPPNIDCGGDHESHRHSRVRRKETKLLQSHDGIVTNAVIQSPFLAAVFGRLEGMVQNSLYSNLLLTGLVSRLAAYPNPLLRSFLLNVNLVFQPSVKSLVQVLSSVRQKVDSFAVTTRNFSSLLPKARTNLKIREDSLLSPSQTPPTVDYFLGQASKPRAATISEMPSEKKKLSLADLFRRSPKQNQSGSGLRGRSQQLQRVQVGGGVGYRFINSSPRHDVLENPEESRKVWDAVYCALVLEEFLKELAALSLEHSVLNYDEGYVSS